MLETTTTDRRRNALLTSVEQAIANALARWLASSLGPDVVVDSRWPEPSRRLPPRAVTVLLAGPPDEDPLDPIAVGRTDVSPTRALVTWRLSALRQPLQIDAWATTDLGRDDLRQRLRSALRAGMGRTIGAFNAEPFRHGVVVPLADGWTGHADCFFDKPQITDTPDAVHRCECRLTTRGVAEAFLTETGETARLVAIALRQRMRAARITTITEASVSHREEP